MRKIISHIFLILFLTSPLYAATYYAEPKGSIDLDDNTSGTGSGTIGDPWSVGQAMATAQAGDTVYFRGGHYYAGQSNNDANLGYYNPTNSGTVGNPITFAAYTGETPVMDAYIGGGKYTSRFFGNGGKTNITFDGFTFKGDDGATCGSFIVLGDGAGWNTSGDYSYLGGIDATNCIVKNCIFVGGSNHETTTDNVTGFATKFTDGALLQNCTFTHYRHTNDYHNTSAVKTYQTHNLIVENCNISDCTGGIFLKSSGDTITIRYNFIYDCNIGVDICTNSYYQDNVSIYHNIVAECDKDNIYLWAETDHCNNLDVYKNTFYKTSEPSQGVVYLVTSTGYESSGYMFRNNVVESPYGTYSIRFGAGITCETGGLDYNAYGTYPRVTDGSASHYSTLAAIQGATIAGLTTGNHNQNSNTGAIVFTNGSGNMNLVSDFALHSSSPGYQAGSDSNDMGADVSLVGVDAGEEDPPSTPTIRSGSIRSGGIR